MYSRLLPLIPLLVFFCFSFTQAQENESSLIRAKVKHGSLMLGGNMSGNYLVTSRDVDNLGNKVNARQINFIMRAKNGYFIREDLAVGLDVNITHKSSKVTDLSERPREPNRETLVLAGPFIRYYMLNGVFGEASALVGLHNFNDVNNKNKALEGGIGIGYAHFINEKFSLEPIISMRYFQKKDRDGKLYQEIGPTFGFGLQVYLLRKKSHVIRKGL
jgi:hypothetical protein